MIATTVLLLLLGIVIVLLIIAANGYFVAQEFAYMSVDRSTLRARAENGDASARRALAVTRRTSFMLSGAQLGITVTGLLVGYVSEPLVGESIGVLLGGVGVPTAVGIAVGTVLALAGATVVQMIFGELFPKNLAIANPEPLSRGLARSTLIYLAAFGWLIALFDRSSNALLRLLRIEPVHDVDSSADATDLGRIIDDSRASGDLPEELSLLLDRILDFPERTVDHAMIPRTRVDAVPAASPIADVRHLMSHAHTRYPVVGENDEPIGVAHLSEVLAADPADRRPIREIMREPLVIPTLMSLPNALDALTRSRNEIACVIDEYGGFAGVLTIEDLAEELVGELTDEHDPDEVEEAGSARDGVWTMTGDVPLDEMERIVDRELPTGDYETLAGLVIAELGHLPALGTTVSVRLPAEGPELVDTDPSHWSLMIEVLDIERHVPSRLRVTLVEMPSGAAHVNPDTEASR